jgi:hypothetical protein
LDNFDAELGMELAQQSAANQAQDKLFDLEGYCLYVEMLDDRYGEFPHV